MLDAVEVGRNLDFHPDRLTYMEFMNEIISCRVSKKIMKSVSHRCREIIIIISAVPTQQVMRRARGQSIVKASAPSASTGMRVDLRPRVSEPRDG